MSTDLITVSDFFCGAGGSSTGLASIPGVHVSLALNHWKTAIATHQLNHPDTAHAHADITHIQPRYTPHTTMLWGSPECTNFTNAKGVHQSMWEGQDSLFEDAISDEAAVRSRATMYDIPRFAEFHEYEIVMTENVVEVTAWRPFKGWLMTMDSLGYNHKILSMNSMHAQAFGSGAPQSRDRVYIVFWKKGNRTPDFDRLRPFAECSKHGRVQAMQAWKNPAKTVGKYRSQYHWRCPQTSCRNEIIEPAVRPAADAIDWTIAGTRIGDRPKKDWFNKKTKEFLGNGPLAPNTMNRAIKGMVDNMGAENYLIEYYGKGGSRGTNVPFSTFTGNDRHALIVPLRRNGVAKTLDKPLDTITGGGNHHAVLEYANQIIDDALLRMIQPHEQMRGMDFPHDYVMLGTKKEQTLQAGNSVTPPASRDIGTICAQSLTPA